MITNRFITKEDYPLLEGSLLLDEFHQGTTADFFFEEGTVCSVYQDENGPILFVRGKPILYDSIGIIQLDIQYLNNYDAKCNLKAMTEGFPELEKKAKENGFSGFFFISNVPLLRKFCIKRLGFQDFGGDFLVKPLLDIPQGVVI
jgi:hypothetical protein